MNLPFFPKRPSSLEQEFATDQIRIRLKLWEMALCLRQMELLQKEQLLFLSLHQNHLDKMHALATKQINGDRLRFI